MRIKNKKAQIFSVFFVVMMLILLGIALATFFTVKNKLEKSIGVPSEMLDAYNEKTKLMLYSGEAAELSSNYAFSSVVKEGISTGECSVVQMDYVLWNNLCKPDTKEIEKKFLPKFDEDYRKLMKDYPSKLINNVAIKDISLVEDKLKIEAENATLITSNDKGYVAYNSTFTFNPSIMFNLSKDHSLADFENVYSIAQKCKDKNETKVRECISFEKWDNSFAMSGNYLLFDLKTKKNYLINRSYKQLSFKFAVEL